MVEEIKFNCSGCGACCKRVGLVIDRFKEMGFPYEVNEQGHCEMLNKDNTCKVYENRPEICNVEKYYEKNYKPLGKEKKDVFLLNAQICNAWIMEDGLDKKYLLNLNEYK